MRGILGGWTNFLIKKTRTRVKFYFFERKKLESKSVKMKREKKI